MTAWAWFPWKIGGDEMWVAIAVNGREGDIVGEVVLHRDGTLASVLWGKSHPSKERLVHKLDPSTIQSLVDRIPRLRGTWMSPQTTGKPVFLVRIRRHCWNTTHLMLMGVVTEDIHSLVVLVCNALRADKSDSAQAVADMLRAASQKLDHFPEIKDEDAHGLSYVPWAKEAPWRPACLVVGAMGCFIFGLYLRRWLRERKALARQPQQDIVA